MTEEPVWLDGPVLDVLAHACTQELGRPVRLPVRHLRVRPRGIDLRRGAPVLPGLGRHVVLRLAVRDDRAVGSLLEPARRAWRSGTRDLCEIAGKIYAGIATAASVGGDRGVLALRAALLFLEANGMSLVGSPEQLGVRLDRLLRSAPDAPRAALALRALVGRL